MTSNIDLSWVHRGRELEVECIDGGRPSSAMTLAPPTIDPDNDEEVPVNTIPVDDAEETEDLSQVVKQYVPYAHKAFSERGLTYPFRASASGDSLMVLPGPKMREMAVRSAALCRIISKTGKPSKEFETRGFRALHSYMGGVGACVGAKRDTAKGPKKAVEAFRKILVDHERGSSHEKYTKSGDMGADGFIILGRPWIGPLIFYQSKNTPFDFRSFPAEFSRVPGIIAAWFGRELQGQRHIIPAYAANTLLTLTVREQIFAMQGSAAVMIIDAADILRAEANDPVPASCTIL